MLLREIDQHLAQLEDVDLADDLQFFMYNDSKFYRRIMYPVLSQMKRQMQSGQGCKHNMFRPCVDTATKLYCSKYKISADEKSVFTDVDRDAVARKIFQQETEQITQGVSDGRNE